MMLFSSLLFTNKDDELIGCGVVDYINPVDKEKKTGRKLFNVNCASCHKLDKYITGPALRNIKFDSLSLHEYLNSKKHQPTFPQVTIDQINEILKYTKD